MLRANLGATAVFLALALAAALLPNYLVFLAISGIIQTLLLLSLGVIVGRAGMISLGQLAFAGVGAWAAAWMALNTPWIPFPVLLCLSGLVAAAVGALLSLPSMRVRGINLGALTLSFALAVLAIFRVTGFPGEASFAQILRPDYLFSDRWFMVACAAVTCGTAVALNWIDTRALGASWQSIRFSERAAASAGRSVATAKVTAFSLSAAIAGIAGALIAFQIGQISSRNFEPLGSLVVFSAAIFIGARYFTGAVIGGILAVVIPDILRRNGLPLDIETALFALGAILTLRGGKSMAEALLGLFAKPVQGSVTSPETIDRVFPKLEREQVPALKVTDLSVRFGQVVALDGVDLTVNSGEVVGLIGPNGAGKSTFIDAVTGFLPNAEGGIELEGRNLAGVAVHKRARLGLRRTYQQGRAVPDLTIRQMMEMGSDHHLDDSEAQAICAFLGCPHPDTLIRKIDVGTRRIIEICAALAARPSVLLLDEPAAGLSHFESEILGARIAEIPARFGCGVLLIEHDIALVRQTCSKLTVVEFGRVISRGDCAEVLDDPRVVEAYLGQLSTCRRRSKRKGGRVDVRARTKWCFR